MNCVAKVEMFHLAAGVVYVFSCKTVHFVSFYFLVQPNVVKILWIEQYKWRIELLRATGTTDEWLWFRFASDGTSISNSMHLLHSIASVVIGIEFGRVIWQNKNINKNCVWISISINIYPIHSPCCAHATSSVDGTTDEVPSAAVATRISGSQRQPDAPAGSRLVVADRRRTCAWARPPRTPSSGASYFHPWRARRRLRRTETGGVGCRTWVRER